MKRYICIHGHFYQPPRENPWLEEIELQDSAYPHHDWNERITSECYAPNTASRILDTDKRIISIVNNYSKMSFNFGPTLLSWMKKHAGDIYQSILDVDKESQKYFSGHGAAIAQAYNHMIMPLSNKRDKQTQVMWGLRDFEHRFERKPEGMWLPETAVNTETLEALAEQGIKFTILAPHQAQRVRKIGDKKWKSLKGGNIDYHQAYLCRLPSGQSISIFFYEGSIAQKIAFGDLLKNGEGFASELLSKFPDEQKDPAMVHFATDGETYGHHHRYGEMALSYCLYHIEKNNLAKVTIYGEFLEKHPPQHEVEIVEDSSWSCAHGVERWKSNCGCCSGLNSDWHQEWRGPLRQALDWLRESLIPIYENEMRAFSEDPWQIRNNYIEIILDRSPEQVENFLKSNIKKEITSDEKIKVLKLLELQYHAMLMYTSCGWFFDEISGIETTQIMQYAARAIQLAKEVAGASLEEHFVKMLESAPSNRPDLQNGAIIYEKYIKPSIVDLVRVGAHYAVSSLFAEHSKETRIFCYTARDEEYERFVSGKQKLAIGKTWIRSVITGEERLINFAVLHLGDHNLIGGVAEFTDDGFFAQMYQEIKSAFKRNDTPATMRLIEKNFKEGSYSLWHLFRDEQSKILYQILDSTLSEIGASLRKINEHHHSIFQVIKQLQIPLPKVLSNTVLVMLNNDLMQVLGSEEIDFDHLKKIVNEVNDWALEIDKATVKYVTEKKVNYIMEEFSSDPKNTELLRMTGKLLEILNPLSLNLDLWKVQNIYFAAGKKIYAEMSDRARHDEPVAKDWVELFDRLGNDLKIKINHGH